MGQHAWALFRKDVRTNGISKMGLQLKWYLTKNNWVKESAWKKWSPPAGSRSGISVRADGDQTLKTHLSLASQDEDSFGYQPTQQHDSTSTPTHTYKEIYHLLQSRLLQRILTLDAYTPSAQTSSPYQASLRQTAQEGADNCAHAIALVKRQLNNFQEFTNLRIEDDIETAVSDLDFLGILPKLLICEHEADGAGNCEFRVVHDLVEQRRGDVERLRREEVVKGG
ncbi:MAG: hypothetical protein Q9172_006956 [Xanthocarpia lactea]